MKLFNTLIIILLSLGTAYAGQDTELSDKIDKTFKVSRETLLSIKNSFGKVEVTNWDKNEFHVVVEILVEANSDQRAQRMMDAIEVKYTESGQGVYFTTSIDNINNKSGESFKVNYTVKMPQENPIEIKNSFGDVYLSDRKGDAELDVSYGALKAENLFGNNEVEVSFGKGYIDRLERGEITIKYSDVEIESSEDLEMDTQFSKVSIGTVEKLELEAKYGSIEIGTVSDLNADASFNGFSIETLTGSLELDASYVSGFEIESVKSTFNLIDIRGKFGSYELNLDDDVSADLEATFEFSDLKSSGLNVEYSYRVKDGHESEYRGKIQGGNSAKRIIIDSSYGDCKIYQ